MSRARLRDMTDTEFWQSIVYSQHESMCATLYLGMLSRKRAFEAFVKGVWRYGPTPVNYMGKVFGQAGGCVCQNDRPSLLFV